MRAGCSTRAFNSGFLVAPGNSGLKALFHEKNMHLEDLTELFTKADNVGETDKTRRKRLIMNLHSTGDLSDDDVAHLFHIYDLGDA